MKRQATRANLNQIKQHIYWQKHGFPQPARRADLVTTGIALLIIFACLYLAG